MYNARDMNVAAKGHRQDMMLYFQSFDVGLFSVLSFRVENIVELVAAPVWRISGDFYVVLERASEAHGLYLVNDNVSIGVMMWLLSSDVRYMKVYLGRYIVRTSISTNIICFSMSVCPY